MYTGNGESSEIDTKDLVTSTDFGVGLGGGVSFPVGRSYLFLEARYTIGLSDIRKAGEIEIGGETEAVPDETTKTRGIQIMAGFSLPPPD